MSGEDWHLDRLGEEDLEAVLAIEREAFAAPWGRICFEGELRQPHAHARLARGGSAKAPGPVLAYIFFQIFAGELHILRTAVAADCRGKGIAGDLLAACLDAAAAKGARLALLEVRPSNRAAVALYTKFGFELVARRPNYYTDTHEDALLMVKPIKEAA